MKTKTPFEFAKYVSLSGWIMLSNSSTARMVQNVRYLKMAAISGEGTAEIFNDKVHTILRKNIFNNYLYSTLRGIINHERRVGAGKYTGIFSDGLLQFINVLNEMFIFYAMPKEFTNFAHNKKNAANTFTKYAEIFNRQITSRHPDDRGKVREEDMENRMFLWDGDYIFTATRMLVKDYKIVLHQSAWDSMLNKPLADFATTKAMKLEGSFKTAKSFVVVREYLRKEKLKAKPITTVGDLIKEIDWNTFVPEAGTHTRPYWGKDREFFIMVFHTRVVAWLIEEVSRKLCKKIPWEGITQGKDQISSLVQREIKNLSSMKNSTGYTAINQDMTKWNHLFDMESFEPTVDGLGIEGALPKEAFDFLHNGIKTWKSRKLYFKTTALTDKSLSSSVLDPSEPTNLHNAKRQGIILKIQFGFWEGLLGSLASLQHCVGSYSVIRAARDNGISNVTTFTNSDDSMYLTPTNPTIIKFVRDFDLSMHIRFGFHENTLKTRVVKIAEIVSQFYERNRIRFPYSKMLAGSFNARPPPNFVDQYNHWISSMNQCLRHGMSDEEGSLFQMLAFKKTARDYSL
jgi:hypothetical protein